MSWLFGIRKDPIVVPEFPSSPGAGGDGGNEPPPKDSAGSGGSNDGVTSTYKFDSSALERAAKAARDLEHSPNARQLLEVTRQQEKTKEMEYVAKVKEYEAYIQDSKSEQITKQNEERRKTLAEETKHNQQRAQYQDQLARKRHEDQLILQQQAEEEKRRRDQESIAKQEAIRQATLEREMDLREKLDLKKIEAKARAKGKVERENYDIHLKKMNLEASNKLNNSLEILKSAASTFGAGFNSFISNPNTLLSAVGGVSLLYLGYYTAKRGTKVVGNLLGAYFSRPSLVKEFYGFTVMDSIKHPIRTYKRYISKSEDTLQGVILNPKLEEVLSMISVATRNTKKNRGNYMNLLLYGPPGTGKTLFARRLAEHCGMHCAIFSGGDIAPLGRRAPIDIHKLFDYADRRRKGLLIFIDEADAFLKKRRAETMSENVRTALNAFLARTGTKSDRYMLVLASNTPDQFDGAINNRIHEVVKFDLPGMEERERLVRLYFDTHILIPAIEGKKKLKVDNFDFNAMCAEVAQMTEGFSGREIANMAIVWQSAAFVAKDGTLTRDMVMKIVHRAVKEYKQKMEWQNTAETKVWSPPLSPLDGSEMKSSSSTDSTASESRK